MAHPPEPSPSSSPPDWGAIIGGLDMVFWEYDPARSRYTHVAGASESVLGFPTDAWLEPDFRRRQVHPDDAGWVLEECDRATAAHRPHTLEYRMLHRDGHAVWVRDSVQLRFAADGVVDRLYGVIADVSDRYRLHEDLRASERWYRSLSAESLDVVTVLDARGVIRYDSPSVTALLGYTVEERQGRSAFDQIHPEDLPAVMTAFAAMLADPAQAHRAEFRYRHRDGGWRQLESLARNLLEDPVVRGVVVHSRDVTGLRAAEAGHRDSESRYREVVEAMPAAVVLLSRDESLVGLNRGAERLLGVAPHVRIDSGAQRGRWRMLDETGTEVPYEARPGIRALRTGRPVEGVQVQIAYAGGPLRWVRIHARPLFHEGAAVPHAVFVVLEDITQQRALESRLAHTERMEAVGRLAGGIAHDFNNLLTAVRGYSELLARALPQGSPHLEPVEQIRQAGERGVALTRQLLAFSRRQPVEMRTLDLAALVRDLSPMLRRLIGDHLTLVLEGCDAPHWVRGDHGQLEQVLLNLVINARDAMPAGGEIRVTMTEVEDGDDPALLLRPRPGRCVRLRVSDDGSGIAPEVLPHVFEPFFTTKSRGEGTGLGLATVYGIVQQSGGGLGHAAVEPRGTRFDVLLPWTDPPPPGTPAHAGHGSEPRSGAGERVLVVEDEPIVRELMQNVLGSGGYRVTTAAQGDEALHLVRNSAEPFDLLVSDVVMPGMSGLELAQRLREQCPALAVLHVSGHAEEALRELGTPVTPAPILAKPFGPETLLRQVRLRLDAGRAAL